MKNPQEYTSVAKVNPNEPIGKRPLTIFEESDMLLLGVTKSKLYHRKPQRVAQQVDDLMDSGAFPLLVGC